MDILIAKNPKQLDIGLRLLYSEKINFEVKLAETNSGKIYYEIFALTDDKTLSIVKEKYRIMTR